VKENVTRFLNDSVCLPVVFFFMFQHLPHGCTIPGSLYGNRHPLLSGPADPGAHAPPVFF
jgi:hypothetical protein